MSWNCALIRACVAAHLLMAASGIRPADGGQTWDQWRGPHRNGQFDGPEWPDRLTSAHIVTKWRVELGNGYSGPVASTDRVFVLETIDKFTEGARAFDRRTGREIWKATWRGGATVSLPARKHGDWIKSTPAFDGQRLYAAGASEVLVCINAADGSILWRFDFPREYKTSVPGFGCVSSPLVIGDHVYMQAANSFVKLDKLTGNVAWRTLVSDKIRILIDEGAEASPVHAVIHQQPQLVVQARCGIHGVEPESGNVLWSQTTDAFMNNDILTPIVSEDYIFTSCQKGGVSLFYIRKTSDNFVAQTAWHQSKPSAFMSSPVISGAHGFLHLENKRFACVDLKTGQTRYTTEPYGDYWSMTVNRDKILALDGRGELLLIQTNPTEFKLLDQRKITDQDTWGHIGVQGDELLVREKNGILVLRWR